MLREPFQQLATDSVVAIFMQGFETTQGQQGEDEAVNAGAVKGKSTRKARQYRNRRVSVLPPVVVPG